MTNNEGGTNDEEFRNVAVVDRVNTTFTVWMGTTMACCPVPHPQVRPDHAEGVLPGLRLLQQHRRRRPRRREPDAAVLDARTAAKQQGRARFDRDRPRRPAEGQEADRMEGRARPPGRAQEGTGGDQAAHDRADHEGTGRRRRAQDAPAVPRQLPGPRRRGDRRRRRPRFHPFPKERAQEPAGARQVAR